MWDICGKEKIGTNYFSLFSFVAVFESGIQNLASGIDKNQDPGNGINIPDPQHWIPVQFGSIDIISLKLLDVSLFTFFEAGDSQDTSKSQASATAKQGCSSSNIRDTDMEDVDNFVESLKYEDSQSQESESESQNFKDSQSLDFKECENLLGNENNLKIFSLHISFFHVTFNILMVNRSFNLTVLLNFAKSSTIGYQNCCTTLSGLLWTCIPISVADPEPYPD